MSDTPVDPWNAGHEAAERAGQAAKPDRKDYEQLLRDYVGTFRTEEGRRVLADLHRLYGGSTYSAGDPVSSHARSAQREVVMRIDTMLTEADRSLRGTNG
jgi:hypothetical protein